MIDNLTAFPGREIRTHKRPWQLRSFRDWWFRRFQSPCRHLVLIACSMSVSPIYGKLRMLIPP